MAVALLVGWAPCAKVAAAETGDDSDRYRIVDCVLPPQMIRLGESSIHFTPSRAAKLSSRLCAQQGGAQKAGLQVWLQLAEGGNTDAQTYLGEMYEFGTGGVPQDIRKAIDWYTRAANAKPKGNTRAISNLASLHSTGAPGLAPDLAKAGDLVRQAAANAGVDTRNMTVVRTGPDDVSAQPLDLATQAGSDLKRFAFGDYHALLIGNSDYAHAPKLNSPVHEIDVIGKTLETMYGFRVLKLKNATRDQILEKLDDLSVSLKESDNLLVYFTGHGAESESHEGYWIPVDGEAPTSSDRLRTRLWIASSDIRTRLAEMKPRHVLLVSDSCYSGRFLQFRGMLSSVTPTPVSAVLQEFGKLYAAKSRGALTSGGLAPVLEPNDDSNLSLFAKAFNQYLQRNRDVIPSVQIFAAIGPQVFTASSKIGFAQQPQWGPVSGSGHESGDFYFRPR